MGHIFISYSSKDRDLARILARLLEKHGWAVWWDKNIPVGKAFDRAIDQALDESVCILVLWSQNSVRSDWVLDEAYEGRQRGILVPTLLEKVHLPFGFRRLQAIDLSVWKRAKEASSTPEKLVHVLNRIAGPPAQKVTSTTTAEAAPKTRKQTTEKHRRRLSGGLDGKTVVFTGALSEIREAHRLKVEAVGANFGTSVTSKTDYLVVGDKPGKVKRDAAEKHGTTLLSEKEWAELLDGVYARILADKNVVFTGRLAEPREVQEERATRLGAKIQQQVTAQTDFLILGDKPGRASVTAAKNHHVEVLEEALWTEIVSTLPTTWWNRVVAFFGG